MSNGALFVPKSELGIRCGDLRICGLGLRISPANTTNRVTAGRVSVLCPEDRMSVSERMQKDAVLVRPGQTVHGSFTFQPTVRC